MGRNAELNINTDAVVRFTAKLEKLHRSDLPIAIRNSLNNAAFDVKKNTMPELAKSNFEHRRENFFKATSKVQMAQGFDIKSMKAMVGFVGNQQAVQDLEQQEHGGRIGGRSFISMDSARTGKSKSRSVRPMNQISKIKNIVNTRKSKGATDAIRFASSVRVAGVGGYVLADYKGKRILWRINSLQRTAAGYKLTALYSFDQGRDVSVSPTHFMQTASLKSAKNLEKYYIAQAKIRVQKYYNKK